MVAVAGGHAGRRRLRAGRRVDQAEGADHGGQRDDQGDDGPPAPTRPTRSAASAGSVARLRWRSRRLVGGDGSGPVGRGGRPRWASAVVMTGSLRCRGARGRRLGSGPATLSSCCWHPLSPTTPVVVPASSVTEHEFRFKDFVDMSPTGRLAMCHPSEVPGPPTRRTPPPPPSCCPPCWATTGSPAASTSLGRARAPAGRVRRRPRRHPGRAQPAGARRGRLEGVRDGRRTAYRLAPALVDTALTLGPAPHAFGAEPVAVGRHVDLRGLLGARGRRPPAAPAARSPPRPGDGPLFDGLWITPHAPLAALDRASDETGVTGAVVFRATEVPRPGGRRPGRRLGPGRPAPPLRRPGRRRRRRWRHRLAAREVEAGARPACARRSPGPAEALVVRTDLMRRWRARRWPTPGCPTRSCPTTGRWPRPGPGSWPPTTPSDRSPRTGCGRSSAEMAPTSPTPRHHRVADLVADPAASAPTD